MPGPSTHLVYDPTAAPPPPVRGEFLPNFVQWQPDLSNVARPRISRSAVQLDLEETPKPPPPASGEFLASLASAWQPSDLALTRRWLRPTENAVFVAPVPGVATPTRLFDGIEPSGLQRSKRRLSDDGFAAPATKAPGEFLPTVMSQWFVHSEARPRRQSPVPALLASSANPVFVPVVASITSSMAAAYSSPVVLTQNVVYDQTTGSVRLPVTVVAPPVVLNENQFPGVRARQRPPFPGGSFVFAIPDFSFGFDYPEELRRQVYGRRQPDDGFAEVLKPAVMVVAPPVVLVQDMLSPKAKQPIRGASDPAASGPIFVAQATVAPPVVLVQEYVFRPLRKPFVSEPFAAPATIAAGEFLPNFVSQWLGQWEPRKARQPIAGALDPATGGPILIAPVVVAPPVVLVQEFVFRSLRKPFVGEGFAAPPAIASGQFLPTFVAQWLGDLSNARIKTIKPGALPADLEVRLIEAPMRGEFLTALMSSWLPAPPDLRRRERPTADMFANWPPMGLVQGNPSTPVYNATVTVRYASVNVDISFYSAGVDVHEV